MTSFVRYEPEPVPPRLRRLLARPLQIGHSLASCLDGSHDLEVLHEGFPDTMPAERAVGYVLFAVNSHRKVNSLSVDRANVRAKILRCRDKRFVHHSPPSKSFLTVFDFCGPLRYFALPLTCIP